MANGKLKIFENFPTEAIQTSIEWPTLILVAYKIDTDKYRIFYDRHYLENIWINKIYSLEEICDYYKKLKILERNYKFANKL